MSKIMKIGLIDVDGHNFPNLPLMKLSAWHKARGDTVEWYEPLLHGFPNEPLDRVYMSKVFGDEYSQDYQYYVNAKDVIKGGTGYHISIKEGKEVFDKENHYNLSDEVEHIYPDYSLYPQYCKDTAYGFLTRGCCNNCSFCIVSKKEGMRFEVKKGGRVVMQTMERKCIPNKDDRDDIRRAGYKLYLNDKIFREKQLYD